MTTACGLTGQLEEIRKELDHAKIAPKNKEKVAPAGDVIGVGCMFGAQRSQSTD